MKSLLGLRLAVAGLRKYAIKVFIDSRRLTAENVLPAVDNLPGVDRLRFKTTSLYASSLFHLESPDFWRTITAEDLDRQGPHHIMLLIDFSRKNGDAE